MAADAGPRRLEAFALFNVFYQAGILAGLLVGLTLMFVDFRATAAAAAVVCAGLTVAQLFALPQRGAAAPQVRTSVLQDWRTVAANRSFLLFAAAMIGSYGLSFQVYLAMPLQARILFPYNDSVVFAMIFVVSGLVTVIGQMRITRFFADRWGASRSGNRHADPRRVVSTSGRATR